MLQKNPLLPPAPPAVEPRRTGSDPSPGATIRFLSAEDFDPTGILVGVDACASRYWWMPELDAVGASPEGGAELSVRRPA